MSERDKILTACGWLADVELPLIAERIVNHSADRITELEAIAILAFQAGYGRGHNDTVESCYNGACEDDPEAAQECIDELWAELNSGVGE